MNGEFDYTVEVAGVEVGFRNPTPGQLVMISRSMKAAQKAMRQGDNGGAGIVMFEQLFNIIETMIVSEEHREHVMDAMMSGVIDIPDAYRILRRGRDEDPDDDQDVEPEKKASKPVAAKRRVQR